MLRAISLFSGCGGFDLGVKRAGFQILYATDIWNVACTSHHQNALSNNTDCADVRAINTRQIREDSGLGGNELDLLFGGPPCPPYSKSRFYRKEKPRALADPTAHTLERFLKLVADLQPRAFILENVPGLAFSAHREALNLVLESANKSNYETSFAVLNAADYGVPQIRQRLFVVGWRGRSGTFRFPQPTHAEDPALLRGTELRSWLTAGDAIGDLDTPANADRTGHRAGGKHEFLLEQVPPGENYLHFTAERGHPNPQFKWRSRYWSFLLKLSPDRPSWTIQARRSNNMGPFHWRNRILRIAEIKRLQSFPDAFQVEGTVDEQWRQIGNAVPPVLAEAVATAVRVQLLGAHRSASRLIA